jgi:hypothetical protein
MPRSRDLAIFVLTTTDNKQTNWFAPCCACAHGVIMLWYVHCQNSPRSTMFGNNCWVVLKNECSCILVHVHVGLVDILSILGIGCGVADLNDQICVGFGSTCSVCQIIYAHLVFMIPNLKQERLQ